MTIDKDTTDLLPDVETSPEVIQCRPGSALKENLFVEGFQDAVFGRGVSTTLSPSKAYSKGYRRGVKQLKKARLKARKLYNPSLDR